MRQHYTEGFKLQAVEKALTRSAEITLVEMAETLGVSRSALSRWISESKQQAFTSLSTNNSMTTQEKRPQDWALAERLELIIQCNGLSDEAMSEACRRQGVFPHHVTQWKQDMISNRNGPADPKKQVTVKQLRDEIKVLNKDLHRKNKALAETAALLVLQKKVNAIWGSDADS